MEYFYPHVLILIGLFSYAFCDFLDGNGWMSIFNTSGLYKIIRIALLIIIALMLFKEFSWWVAILYLVGGYFSMQLIVGLVAGLIFPPDFFGTGLRRGPARGKEKAALTFIFFNYFLMIAILIGSIASYFLI